MIDKIRSALVTKALTTLTGAPVNMPVASIVAENFPRPETSGDWVQFFFKPNIPFPASLGQGGRDECSGVLLVNVHSPLDDGSSYGLKVANTFRKDFVAGDRLIFEGQEVMILGCGVNLGRTVDTWYRSDVSVQWRAYLQRGVA